MNMRSFAARVVVPSVVVAALLAGCDKAADKAGAQGDAAPAQAASAVAPAASLYNDAPVLPPSHPVIDVWKLRDEVAKLEPMVASDETEGCSREGDGQETEQELKAMGEAEQACVEKVHARYAAYQGARKEFNTTWLPVMMDAIRQGDLVAEVIMRQCAITPVFDRGGIESSCDQDPARRKVAARRLREIGFAPAFDLEGEAMERRAQNARLPYVAPVRAEVQQRVLAQFRQGMFGVSETDMLDASHNGNAPKSPDELEDIRRAAVIDAALQEVPRAFTYSSGWYSAGWHTDRFGGLALARKPMTPGYLTWGRRLYYGGQNTYWTGPQFWRSGPLKVYLQYDHDREVPIAYQGDAVFMGMLHDTLAAADASINRYLAQDKRWSVFLIHRVGLHEWVPEGMESDTGQLESAWQGEWVLEKTFVDWKPQPIQGRVTDRIYADGGATRIQSRIGSNAPYPPCQLRYSGGKTYVPGASGLGSSSTDTPLGYLPAISNISQFDPAPVEAFAPLDPKVQYPQVLVQCPEKDYGERGDEVHFLLLAKDTLISVYQTPGFKTLTVSHYRRAGAPPANL